MNLTILIPAFLIATAVSAVLIPIIIKVSHRKGWYDSTDPRKIHDGDIPRLGGMGIFLGFLAGLFVLIFAGLKTCETYSCPPLFQFLVFVFAAGGIHITGLIDDFTDMRPRNKFIIQILAAVLATASGLRFYGLNLIFTNITIDIPVISWIITIVWIVGVCNAVNLIDGLDGLSSTVSIIATISFGIIAIATGSWLTAIIAFSLAGGILGFLFYNKPKAKIFMGDSGSLFLGFTLAIMPLIEISSRQPKALIFAITILLIPITDTLFAIARRVARKQAISSPDREHIHHTLLDLNFSNVKILFLVGSYALLLGALPFIVQKVDHIWAIGLLVVLWAFSFWLFYWLHKLVRTRSAK
ncbi:MAG: undecaprenyl/decaprenyl-phosphate alpha-N-acetylglucosaminyl 1-phosphate transferase [Spirochaetales bacterium]|nr:undecaprenyl/decaprenyl-phosphate alpha-N-acetylglucosaminyl 1-phosphate transferase [Spirochaetales bacterium]